jgi:hypothetical protein
MLRTSAWVREWVAKLLNVITSGVVPVPPAKVPNVTVPP